jgi:hypothetical protein
VPDEKDDRFLGLLRLPVFVFTEDLDPGSSPRSARRTYPDADYFQRTFSAPTFSFTISRTGRENQTDTEQPFPAMIIMGT